MQRFSNAVPLSMNRFTQSQDQAPAQTRERGTIPGKYCWNLEDIYPTDADWRQAKDELSAQFHKIQSFQGRLAQSAHILLECLEFGSHVSRELTRLYCYASMKSDQDTRVSQNLSLRQEIELLLTDYNAQAAFVEPEIKDMDQVTLDAFLAQESGLESFRMYLDNIQRTKAHRLGQKEEKIIAETNLLAGGASTIYSIFSNAELPYPTIVLSDGTEATLNKSGYAKHRAHTNRADREAVFNSFWEVFYGFKQTFGTQLYAQVKKDMFFARVRNYESSLHSALDADIIPVDVYHALVNNVHANLDNYPIHILKKAGVDMTTAEPFQKTMAAMNRIMDEIEAILS